jgi:4-amino-4-deoxy-L-arabinose transferase-like glycosyltransferase
LVLVVCQIGMNSPGRNGKSDMDASNESIAPRPGTLFSSTGLASPPLVVGCIAAMQLVLWTLFPAIVSYAPALDTVEAYVYGPHWVLGSAKHPALPSWVLETSRLLTGEVGWPALLVSQIFVAAAFGFVFLLGRDLTGDVRAACATLLLTGIVYYSWLTPEFNHNVAQLPLWAGMVFALWRAVERSLVRYWLLFAFFATIMVYAKLSALIAIAAAGVWLIADSKGRSELRTYRPWLAAALFVAGTAPLAMWLVANSFAPLHYAAARSAHGANAFYFLGQQVAAMAGLLALMVYAALRTRPAETRESPRLAVVDRGWLFLLLLGVFPIAALFTVAALTDTGLKGNWGEPMLGLSGLVAVALVRRSASPEFLFRLAQGSVLLLIVLPAAFAAQVVSKGLFSDRPHHMAWPQKEIAAKFREVWLKETGEPLRIVAGGYWTAGLVALQGQDMAAVLINGNPKESPWIGPDAIRRHGLLVVWTDAESKLASRMLNHFEGQWRDGRLSFELPYPGRLKQVTISYAIIRPGAEWCDGCPQSD